MGRLCLFFLVLGVNSVATSATAPSAHWVWAEGHGREETVYFRRRFSSPPQLTQARVWVTCDNRFVFYLNGRRFGQGNDWQLGKFYDLTDALVAGENLLAIQATNEGGVAGFAFWLQIVSPDETQWIVSDSQWKVTRRFFPHWEQTSFLDTHWEHAISYGPFEKALPWSEFPKIRFVQDLPPSHLKLHAPGFRLERVASSQLTGSVLALAFDALGRPVVSREGAGLFTLVDVDGDGLYESSKKLTTRIRNAQGIAPYDPKTMYVVGDGPRGVGLYRLIDSNQDGVAEQVERVVAFTGEIGEHGPHAVVVGPDGFLYVALGNFSRAELPVAAGSPVDKRFLYEGEILPRYEDSHGHAAGVRVPGGTVWRFDPKGQSAQLEAVGFRNHYDIAFGGTELFTFDSDMEWDLGLPWYRPIRLYHTLPGSEMGWRSGSLNWPSDYADSIPELLGLGRGSPTGVAYYDHWQFPRSYRGTLFLGDWSAGRILVATLRRKGASFEVVVRPFLTGAPLNVTALEVGPDGSLFFTTGGRGTEGGLYRIYATAGDTNPRVAAKSPVEQLLGLSQLDSSWAQEQAAQWIRAGGATLWGDLERAILDERRPLEMRLVGLHLVSLWGYTLSPPTFRALVRDTEPRVREWAAWLGGRTPNAVHVGLIEPLLNDDAASVRRVALESLRRRQMKLSLATVRSNFLASSDRFLRYAGLLALRESPDLLGQGQKLLRDANAWVAVTTALALLQEGSVLQDKVLRELVFTRLEELLASSVDTELALGAIRAAQLLFAWSSADLRARAKPQFEAAVLARFPTLHAPLDREFGLLLAQMGSVAALPRLLEQLERTSADPKDRSQAIHFARCLIAIRAGWSVEARGRFLDWFEASTHWQGGESFRGYLDRFYQEVLTQIRAEGNSSLLSDRTRFPQAVARWLEGVNETSSAQEVERIAELLGQPKLRPWVREQALLALGRLSRRWEAAGELLMSRYETSPAERKFIVLALAQAPNEKKAPYFVLALTSKEKPLLRTALGALEKVEWRSQRPEEWKALIEAGAYLKNPGAWEACRVLRKWAGRAPSFGPAETAQELRYWASDYARRFPTAPLPDLSQLEFKPLSFDEIWEAIASAPSGDPSRGGRVFEAASCAKCHRLGNMGQGGIGPDLSTLSKRFQRKEILESIVFPSKVVSDQFRAVTVLTTGGQVLSGMRGPDEPGKLVLHLADGSTRKLSLGEVEAIRPSEKSLMPEGLLDDLSLEEIRDLMAFLEQSAP